MNRIFYGMVLVAFLFAAARQLTWEEPPAQAVVVEAPVAGLDSPDPRIASLAAEVARLRERVPAPAIAPPPKSPMAQLQDAILDRSQAAVVLILGLIGAMAFFLGVMRVAQDGGMLTVVARLIRPLLVRAFPDVPPDHPAMGAMILNLSANALGLGNAATPFGIKAMQELDRLNRHKGTATNAMALFLAINTSSVTLLPTGVIVWRETLGSRMPADILPTTLFATLCSTATAIVAAKVFERLSSAPDAVTPAEDVRALEPYEGEGGDAYPAWMSYLAVAALVVAIPLTVWKGRVFAPWVVPLITVGFLTFGAVRGAKVYESFVAGAREGWDVAVRIVPYLVAILAVVGMFQVSGAMDALVGLLDPITSPLGLPGEALPMALLRPLSGSGALGVMVGIMQDPATGPDTYTGFLVSTIQGSTETTFYVLAVYFGAVGVHRLRHTVIAALLGELAGTVGSVIAVRAYFAWNGMPAVW